MPEPDHSDATAGADADGDKRHMDLRKLFEVWVDSDLKARIILFYNNNPGVVETMEGLARRLGTQVDSLRQEIAAHVELGLLRQRTFGDKQVLVYDRERRSDIEAFIEDALMGRLNTDPASGPGKDKTSEHRPGGGDT